MRNSCIRIILASLGILIAITSIPMVLSSCSNQKSAGKLSRADTSRSAETAFNPQSSAVLYLPHTNHLSNAVTRFITANNGLPRSYSDLRNANYLFFNFPHESVITGWQSSEDELEIRYILRFRREKSGKPWTRKYFRPGSPSERQRLEGNRKGLLRAYRSEPNSFPEFTESEIINGVYPIRWEFYNAFCKGAEEVQQMMWAEDLCYILATFAMNFIGDNKDGLYPSSAQELLDYIGEVNAKAWVAPITGKETRLKDAYDGQNPAYEVSSDRKTFTVTVPLFGAGGKREVEQRFLNLARNKPGLKLGEYYRVTRSYDPLNSTPFIYADIG